MAIGADRGSPVSFRVKNFPPGRRGVLLPLSNRRAAALGVCLLTVSKPRPLILQHLAFWAVRLLGARTLPGSSTLWSPPTTVDEWSSLDSAWRGVVGHFDAISAYRRRQVERGGVTALLTRGSHPVAVVKLRTEARTLEREQRALEAVRETAPKSFRSPSPLGSGAVGGLYWSAQSAVFTRPHRPSYDASDRLFDDVGRVLASAAPDEDGECLAHNDVTPWNLRLDHRGQLWLFDWEDWGAAPTAADRTYYAAARTALTGQAMPALLPESALSHWEKVLVARNAQTDADVALRGDMLAALRAARAR